MNAHRLVQLGVATLVMASAAGISGCSFDLYKDDSPDAPKVNLVRAGRLLSQAETKLAVPSAGEASGGYIAEGSNMLQPTKPDGYTIRPRQCDALYSGLDLDYVKAPAKTYLTYINSEKIYLGVGVSSRPGSPAGIAKASAVLDGCTRFEVKEGKATIRMSATPLPFPKMGEASIAIRYTVRLPGVKQPATYDTVRIAAGHNTVLVDGLSLTAALPIPGELEGAADTALLKLSR